jgi:cell division initiation protein
MALTPLEIRKPQFRTILRGLDPDEVRAFLNLVAGEMEMLIRDNASLREQTTVLQAKLEEYQNLERNLRDAVLAAQNVREDSRRQAEQEGKLVLARVELEAESRQRMSEQRLTVYRRELADLRAERQNYLIRLRGLIETHLRMIEAAEARGEDEHDLGLGGEDAGEDPGDAGREVRISDHPGDGASVRGYGPAGYTREGADPPWRQD